MKKWTLLLAIVLLCSAAPVQAANNYTGTWDTTYGQLTLVQKGAKVTGTYYKGKATLDGIVIGRKLTFTYKEKGEEGKGEFTLSADGGSFTGRYRAKTAKAFKDWKGTKK